MRNLGAVGEGKKARRPKGGEGKLHLTHDPATMFPYVVAGLACLLVFWHPLLEYVAPSYAASYAAQRGGGGRVIPRTPRPPINESLLALEDDGGGEELRCPPDAYVVHVLSKAPLVLYVENFVSEEERAHFLDIR